MLDRRTFLAAAAAAPIAIAQDAPNWGGPVVDLHLHPKQGAEGEIIHMSGCGVTHAVLLANVAAEARAAELVKSQPKKFARFSGTDTSKADAVDILRKSKSTGAIGFGELKSHVAIDGPEMARVFALAAELGVPVLLHLQEVEQFAGEGIFNYHIDKLPAVVKANPKTTFIGHGDAFWASVSAEPIVTPYPVGKIKPGGVTDRVLGEFPNMYGDLSANSGRNCLNRDPEFMSRFLERHKNKLMFGSDCSCTDGRGAGQRSTQPLIKGKCVARETLTALKKMTTPALFGQLTWGNTTRLLKVFA